MTKHDIFYTATLMLIDTIMYINKPPVGLPTQQGSLPNQIGHSQKIYDNLI